MKNIIITTIFAIICTSAFAQDYITSNTNVYSVKKCAGYASDNGIERYNDAYAFLNYDNATKTAEVWIKRNGKKSNYNKYTNVDLVIVYENGNISGYMVVDSNNRYVDFFEYENDKWLVSTEICKLKK